MANLPSRPADALPGSQFMESIMKMGATANRDDLIVKEVIRGNFPDFLRKLVPITINEKGNSVTYSVMPDYLSIGNDQDYVRVPISGPSAQRVADAFSMMLPTPRISDQIHDASSVKLAPKPLSQMSSLPIGGKNISNKDFMARKMSDTDSFEYHNQLIQDQLTNHKPGELVSGHKKDVVISNDISPGKLGIHGMHLSNGKPIQPGGGSMHEENYKDYSHGIRLVDKVATLNGKQVDFSKNVLQDPKYAYLVNYDGALKNLAYNYKKDATDPKAEETGNNTQVAQYSPDKPQSGRMQLIQRIDNMMSTFKA